MHKLPFYSQVTAVQSKWCHVPARLSEPWWIAEARGPLWLPMWKRVYTYANWIFGASDLLRNENEAVELGLATSNGERLKLSALAVPFICDPVTSQPISYSRVLWSSAGARVADAEDVLEVDVLIESDLYRSLVTGGVWRGRSGPTAIQTKVGWVLSGPVGRHETSVNLTLATTHTPRIDTYPVEQDWITNLDGYGSWSRSALWKGSHLSMRSLSRRSHFSIKSGERTIHHCQITRKWLTGLLKRLKQNPQLLAEYEDQMTELKITAGHWPFSVHICQSANHFPKWLAILAPMILPLLLLTC